jgi:hypothetical protein
MKPNIKKNHLIITLLAFIILLGYPNKQATALILIPQNIQAMAVYGPNSNYGIGLASNINFNITDPVVISNLISSIEFSVERDCSTIAGISGAYVYIKFKNGVIDVYDLLDVFSHFSKVGINGSCYFISETGQAWFEGYAQ